MQFVRSFLLFVLLLTWMDSSLANLQPKCDCASDMDPFCFEDGDARCNLCVLECDNDDPDFVKNICGEEDSGAYC
jgi:hypothetical protein